MPTFLLCSDRLGIYSVKKKQAFLSLKNSRRPSEMTGLFQKLSVSKIKMIIACTLYYVST